MEHVIFISVGSNIERDKHVRNGVQALHQHFDDVRVSSVFESESVGFDGNAFYNLAVAATTRLSVIDVCKVLKEIERENGRERGEKKFAPRTLDLDLLLYDDLITEEHVSLPRGEIEYNAFVLWPLSELAPEIVHPVTGETLGAMWRDYDKTQQQLSPIPFTWSNA